MPLCPALAYPHTVIDPAMEDASRDDGENMLRKLRPVWRSLARDGNSNLLTLGAEDCLASAICGTGDPDVPTVPGLLDSAAEHKPSVRLVAPRTACMLPETMDSVMTTEQRCTATVPIRGSRECAIQNLPAEVLPKPKIVITFPKTVFKPDARQNAEMEITRSSADGLIIKICAMDGSRKTVKGSVQDARMLDRAFDPSDLIRMADRDLLPSLPNELPASIMMEIADFWQTSLRAHALVAACQPCDQKSMRFLTFSKMTVGSVGRDAISKRIVVKATLHPSAAECICCVHGLKPVEQQYPQCKFTSSKVDLTMSMCGRKLERPSSAMTRGICPLHKGGTPDVRMVNDVCCHGTTCEVSCAHFTDKREFKPGLWIRNIPLDTTDVLHVQALIATAMRCTEAVGPMIAKRKREEIKEACDSQSQVLSGYLEQINRYKTCRQKVYGADELMRMDWKAADMLREHKVRQYRRPTTKEVVLAAPRPDGSGLAPLTRPDADLNDHHKWLFKPPARY